MKTLRWLPRASLFSLIPCALLPFALMGCLGTSDDSSKKNSSETQDVSDLLSNYANEVVLADYAALADAAQALNGAATTLSGGISEANVEANVEAARTAWIATREPWEQSESLLFGPVDTQGIDPSLDTWPLDTGQLDTAIADVDNFDPDTADDNVKGFHTIEYLLWDANDTAANVAAILAVDSNRVDYLVAITADLAGLASTLEAAWDPDGDDFVSEFADAGQGSETYTSQSAAMQEIVNGMIGIADEVANGKLFGPYSEEDVNLVESQFSHNSLLDFQDNIIGIRNAYLGAFGAEEAADDSLSKLVRSQDKDLDDEMKEHIEEAIAALAAIEPSFEDAVEDGDPDGTIAEAIDTINHLREDMEELLLPLVQDLDYTY